MEPKDWITLSISIASLCVAAVALYKTAQHNATMRQYATAAPDIAVLAQINQARMTMANIALKMAEISKGKTDDKLTDKERRQVLDIGPIYSQAVETLLTSYDLACRLYRDGSIDRERFRRQYGADIRKFFEEGTDADKERLGSIASPYKALRAVYEEWNNQEK